MDLTDNAERVLKARYLQEGESPYDMFERVALHVASAEKDSKQEEWYGKFYSIMRNLDFLPNSPTLMNAGTGQGSLSACFVIPVEDTLEGIMDAAAASAMVQKFGGGTGFSLSRLRAHGATVSSTHGIACGPIAVLKLLNEVSQLVTQGGKRAGANMAVMRYDHPDILQFIQCKDNTSVGGAQVLANFNISVGIDVEFRQALERDVTYELVDPHTGPTGTWLEARHVLTLIAESAWRTGDPGIIFLDKVNASTANPVPSLGPIDATNPCGEQPLYDWGSCTLGSINLANFCAVQGKPENWGKDLINWEHLGDTIDTAVRFLDNVVEVNSYPLPQIEEHAKSLRRIGLGVMGWADLLFKLEIPYNSDRAVELAGELSEFINKRAFLASQLLGLERDSFPLFSESIYFEGPHLGDTLRNSTRTTIAPTGSISIIAGCSSGIEPVFALKIDRQHGENIGSMKERNPVYEEWLKTVEAPEFLTRDEAGGVTKPDYFVTAHDIEPIWHLKHQQAWQQHVDNAVSKTINIPNDATVEDVKAAYTVAMDMGLLGVTVYRDGSHEGQVLSITKNTETDLDVSVDDIGYLGDADMVHESHRNNRKRLPDDRPATIHKFRIGDLVGYITVGFYDDGCPGEMFVTLSKEGSTISGLVNTIAKLTSIALQHGVEIGDLLDDFRETRFEPMGMTGNPTIPNTTSIVDYIFKHLAQSNTSIEVKEVERTSDELCPDCGQRIVHEEGCLKCQACGWSRC